MKTRFALCFLVLILCPQKVVFGFYYSLDPMFNIVDGLSGMKRLDCTKDVDVHIKNVWFVAFYTIETNCEWLFEMNRTRTNPTKPNHKTLRNKMDYLWWDVSFEDEENKYLWNQTKLGFDPKEEPLGFFDVGWYQRYRYLMLHLKNLAYYEKNRPVLSISNLEKIATISRSDTLEGEKEEEEVNRSSLLEKNTKTDTTSGSDEIHTADAFESPPLLVCYKKERVYVAPNGIDNRTIFERNQKSWYWICDVDKRNTNSFFHVEPGNFEANEIVRYRCKKNEDLRSCTFYLSFVTSKDYMGTKTFLDMYLVHVPILILMVCISLRMKRVKNNNERIDFRRYAKHIFLSLAIYIGLFCFVILQNFRIDFVGTSELPFVFALVSFGLVFVILLFLLPLYRTRFMETVLVPKESKWGTNDKQPPVEMMMKTISAPISTTVVVPTTTTTTTSINESKLDAKQKVV